MTEGHENNIYTLISKYLAAEANADEQAQVEAWIQSSKSNRKEFEKLEKLWLFTSQSTQQHDLNVNVDKAWEKLHNRMQAEDPKVKPIHSFSKNNGLLFYLYRVAAVFLLAVSVFFIYKLFTDDGSDQQKTLYANAEISVETLLDSSTVTLNRGSQISFNDDFNKTKRFIELKGEAFFEVQPNSNKPFIVDVNEAQVIVLGTSFNVLAYDSLNYIQIGVQEGKVKVLTENDSIILTSGESVAIDKSSAKLQKKEKINADLLFWISDRLVFKNERLDKVFKTLELHYGIDIKTADTTIFNCKLTAKFEGENIDRIFEIIAANFNLKILKKQNKYIIEGEGC